MPGSSREERSAWPFVEMTQQTLDRAVAVQNALAERSQQRRAKIADLLIAAAAETAGLVVLHYDQRLRPHHRDHRPTDGVDPPRGHCLVATSAAPSRR